MTRSLLAALLLMCLLSVPVLGRSVIRREIGVLASPRETPPVTVIKATTVDLGVIESGKIVRARFRVTNAGRHRLVVNEVGRSCDCVSGGLQNVVVLPGHSVELVPVLETHTLSGPVQLEVHYTTSDPALPRLTLTVLADVRLSPEQQTLPNEL